MTSKNNANVKASDNVVSEKEGENIDSDNHMLLW